MIELSKTNPGELTGLRARQKKARYDLILEGAQVLFNSLGFDDTTMAAIAARAQVSTPTVFNYFRSKDELLLALVLRVHDETRTRVRQFQIDAALSSGEAISAFLGMYSRMSLEAINRQTWRHVESTCIRMPNSEFVQRYDALTAEMLVDFVDFLRQPEITIEFGKPASLQSVATILFSHWSRLFIDLVRDEAMNLEQHQQRLAQDLIALIDLLPADGR